jgi:ParB family chromosome partitioning protein
VLAVPLRCHGAFSPGLISPGVEKPTKGEIDVRNHHSLEPEALSAPAEARLAEITARLEQLTEHLEVFGDDDRAIAGAVVTVRHDGSVLIQRGLVRREDLAVAVASGPAASGQKAEAAPADLPASLVRSCHNIGQTPCRPSSPRENVALAAVVHALTLPAFYLYGANSRLDLRTGAPRLGSATQSAAAAALMAERDRWGDHLPGAADALSHGA